MRRPRSARRALMHAGSRGCCERSCGVSKNISCRRPELGDFIVQETAKTTFVFSGQGSQHYQMARSLFDREPVFNRWMVRLDALARELCGTSVLETVYSDRHRVGDSFDRTLLTHPAIFMVEYSLAEALIDSGVVPDTVVGASLGSFAAAAVAGFVDVEQALTAVVGQARALEARCEAGAMLAVFGNPDLHWTATLREHTELAAVNFSSHFVIATPIDHVASVEAQLKRTDLSYQRLPVSYAFHSRWIDAAREPFHGFTHSVRWQKGRLPLVCCDRAATLAELPSGFFWDVVRRPIRLRHAIEHLEQGDPRAYIDVGPGGTFATFLKYGLPEHTRSSVRPILSPYGRDEQRFADVCARFDRRNRGVA